MNEEKETYLGIPVIKNFEYCKYTYLHRLAFKHELKRLYLNDKLNIEEYFELNKRSEIHDIDKMVLYLFWSKPEASNYHKHHAPHHIFTFVDGIVPSDIDIIESLIDFQCAPMTKPDKQLNAYQTVMEIKSNYIDIYKPYLEKLGYTESDTIEDIEFVNTINNTEVKPIDILKACANYLYENFTDNIYTQLKSKLCSIEELTRLITYADNFDIYKYFNTYRPFNP